MTLRSAATWRSLAITAGSSGELASYFAGSKPLRMSLVWVVDTSSAFPLLRFSMIWSIITLIWPAIVPPLDNLART